MKITILANSDVFNIVIEDDRVSESIIHINLAFK